ncbi:helix-turn-helix domain-containing protein [Treponema sp. OMZ 799]|nr:helix-turn-helix domain-containing protein [Treponema sp. OMZ 799]
MEKLYTMNQIAEMLELSVRTIQNYLKEGKLTGKK